MTTEWEARVRPIYFGNDRSIAEVTIRNMIERVRPGYADPPRITVRLTITEEDAHADFDGALGAAQRLTDHGYLLRKARDLLAQAAAAPWSQQDAPTIHRPKSAPEG